MSFKFSFRPRYSSFIIPVLNIYFSRFRKCLYLRGMEGGSGGSGVVDGEDSSVGGWVRSGLLHSLLWLNVSNYL